MKFSSLRINAKYHLFQHDIFNPHPRFSHVLGQFPPCIFLCSSYLEASKPFFLLSESKVFIFGLPSDNFFGHYSFNFFLDETMAHLPSFVDELHFPCSPRFPAHHLPLICVTTTSKCSKPCICSLFSGKSLIPPALLSAQSLLPVGWFFLFLLLQQSCIILLT